MYGIDSFLFDRTGYDLEASVFEPTANIAGLLSGYTEAGVKRNAIYEKPLLTIGQM
jgi:hypothetical protein